MKVIAVAFVAALAFGAAMPAAQAAQNTNTGGTTLKVQTDGLLHAADELSARRGGGGGGHGGHRGGGGGGRHGWHGGGGGRHGFHGGGGRRWHGNGGWHGRSGWHGRNNWGGRRGWYGGRVYGWRGYGWRGYGWRGYGYGWPRHRVCWRVWNYGRLVTVCRWRRW